jgi:hypothetical protein
MMQINVAKGGNEFPGMKQNRGFTKVIKDLAKRTISMHFRMGKKQHWNRDILGARE